MAADEIRLFGPVAIRPLLERLAAGFTAETGWPVASRFELNPKIAELILEGAPFDLALSNPAHIEAVIGAGRAAASTHRAFGRVPLALARRGPPDAAPAESPEAIRALLSGAGSVAYTGEGTSGKTFLDALARLGLSETMASRVRPMGAGEPVAALAEGAVDLAAAPLSTVLAKAAIAPAAILPPGIAAPIEMSMVLSPDAAARDGPRRLLDRLADRALDAVLAEHGLRRFALG